MTIIELKDRAKQMLDKVVPGTKFYIRILAWNNDKRSLIKIGLFPQDSKHPIEVHALMSKIEYSDYSCPKNLLSTLKKALNEVANEYDIRIHSLGEDRIEVGPNPDGMDFRKEVSNGE